MGMLSYKRVIRDGTLVKSNLADRFFRENSTLPIWRVKNCEYINWIVINFVSCHNAATIAIGQFPNTNSAGRSQMRTLSNPYH
jgi:hypothetical protein